MWLPWRRNRHDDGESEKAIKEADAHVRHAHRRGEEVTELAEALREFRHHNHFAEKLEQMIIRGRG